MPLSDYYPQLKGWTEVTPPTPPAIPLPPEQVTTAVNPRLRTSIPLPFQYSPDTLRQFNRPEVSSFRLLPVAPAGIPAVNSATISAAQNVTAKTSVTLDIPNIFTPVTQTVELPGTLEFSLAPEPASTALMGPLPTFNQYTDAVYLASLPNATGASTLAIGPVTPVQAGEFLFCLTATNIPSSVTPGGTTPSSYPYFSLATIPLGTTPFLANFTGGSFSVSVVAASILTNGLLTLVQSQQASGLTATFTNTVPSSHTIFVCMYTSGNTFSIPYTVTDDKGNAYDLLGTKFEKGPFLGGPQASLFACFHPAGNPKTITASRGTAPPVETIGIFDYSGVVTFPGAIPTFRRPEFIDLLGNISINQMNGGIGASSSTFWRGDGTWAAVSVPPTIPVVVEVNAVNRATNRFFCVDGIDDGAAAWGSNVNGVPDGG